MHKCSFNHIYANDNSLVDNMLRGHAVLKMLIKYALHMSHRIEPFCR